MITFDRVSVRYDGAEHDALHDVTLTVDEGSLALVVGRTGSGKSTLLRAVNGLVPHFSGGTLTGTVTVAGRDTRDHPPRELADVVGVVGQDPAAGFVGDTVETELAYTMEQLGIAADVMRTRVEEVLDVLGIAELRHRSLGELSGGQQQRVAIGAALVARPAVLVLDEPTSALDPTAAEDVLAAVTRLVHDLGVTVVMAEHRLERVVQYADLVVAVDRGHVEAGDPATMMSRTVVAPPVVDLGRSQRWHPLPLSVRDARRRAGGLRDRLALCPGVPRPPEPADPGAAAARRTAVLQTCRLGVRYGTTVAVAGVDLDVAPGEVVAVMGRNGSGKSSLLWAVQGSGPRTGGAVTVQGTDPATLAPADTRRLVALVPQTSSDLLFLDTVDAELSLADAEARSQGGPRRHRVRDALRPRGTPTSQPRVRGAAVAGPDARALLDRLAPGIPGSAHPRDLSEGQQLALVLAAQLCARPAVVLLDEPTRGLDYGAKAALGTVLTDLAEEGTAVVVATHDVEFVAATATRVVVMATGEVVADGPTARILAASPAFAPQTARVLAPLPLLTPLAVDRALAIGAAGR